MHSHRHNIFLNGNRVVIISLTVQKLLETYHGIINNFLLRLQFSFKHDEFFIVTSQNWHRTLEEGVDVNCESITNVIHNGIYTWPGLLVWASFFTFFFRNKSDSLASWQKLRL
ncbi:MAG TPA: hypothetical protein DCQ92_01230 [Verrucomicrobia subdivision 3 bacterium]|nr:hypothetical protein [Limisphaerales bacterium]